MSGGLISHGMASTNLFRRTASYVDNILKGAKRGNLPVQQPTKFELVINPRRQMVEMERQIWAPIARPNLVFRTTPSG
jgi:ABC-type uncharacterized transport system substrate-binding protein